MRRAAAIRRQVTDLEGEGVVVLPVALLLLRILALLTVLLGAQWLALRAGH